MRRRDILVGLLGGGLVMPLAGRAQKKLPPVAFLEALPPTLVLADTF